jgi:protein-S-isoprenylcysteine O-methyltransferase Ste14
MATKVKWGFNASYGVMMLALPPLVCWMWICMLYYGGEMTIPTSGEALREMLSHVPAPTLTSVLLYGGWFLLQVGLQLWAPGNWVKGAPVPDGSRLNYKMNGWFSWWVTLALAAALVGLGWISPTILHDQFGPLMTTVNIFTFLLCVYLYYVGKQQETADRPTGRPVYDYFMGTALNPRNGSFDWKLFCEARPGLILWVLINFSLAAKQYELHGTVTTPMILVCFFHFWYIADYYFHEDAILTTWDIKHENFGWMLCWGDLVWVPFTYTLQAQYLLTHTHDLPWWGTAGIVLLNLVGFAIFRGTNIQKHKFRLNPERLIWGKQPEYIRTEGGSLLLTSGFWGLARHLNYFGDLLMGLAWCLPCLFTNLLPYFYIIYFTLLLVHRERRDDAMCLAKYGQDWEAYRRKVPYRIVPRVY